MTEAERAAALADEIERFGAGHEKRGFKIDEEALIVRVLREFASTDDDEADMATIGRSLMNAIAVHQETPDDPLFEWAPADNPAEVVGDLVEMVIVARGETEARPAGGLREMVTDIIQDRAQGDYEYGVLNAPELADAILSTIHTSGWRIVPAEPTEEAK